MRAAQKQSENTGNDPIHQSRQSVMPLLVMSRSLGRQVSFFFKNFFLDINITILRTKFSQTGRNTCTWHCYEYYSRFSAELFEHFIEKSTTNSEKGRQRKAAAINYLFQLLFHNASVLQCDWLLFGALCCQHLACRAKYVAEKVSQDI